jgi:tetrahydromethanopterin S-methyltransferase subunit B
LVASAVNEAVSKALTPVEQRIEKLEKITKKMPSNKTMNNLTRGLNLLLKRNGISMDELECEEVPDI